MSKEDRQWKMAQGGLLTVIAGGIVKGAVTLLKKVAKGGEEGKIIGHIGKIFFIKK